MEEETIFWVVFLTGKGQSDRRQYFNEEKTLKEFHVWIEEMRDKAEQSQGKECVIQNMGIINKRQKQPPITGQ